MRKVNRKITGANRPTDDGDGESVRPSLRELEALRPFPLELRQDKALVFRPLEIKMMLETAVVVPARGSLAPAARALADFIRAEHPASAYSVPVE